MPLLRPAATALLDLLLPGACAGCGRPGPPVCDLCQPELIGHACLWQPTPPPAGLPLCARAAPYDGVARSALIAFKEHGRADLARPLGVALATAVVTMTGPAGPPIALVPVPSSPAAIRRRGREHAVQIARSAANHLRDRGMRARVLPLLATVRTPADQSGLDAARRAANVRNVFMARAGHSTRSDQTLILVDDIVTTGATASECAKTLAAAGWPVAGVAAVAAAVLRRPVRRDADLGTPVKEVQTTPSVVSVGIA
jgi:predicted amidophosphoribosyltransferase